MENKEPVKLTEEMLLSTLSIKDSFLNEGLRFFLQQHNTFQKMTVEQLHDLMQVSSIKKFKTPGEVIVKEGEPAEYFYFILEGEVSVQRIDKESKKEIKLATLREGNCFGEKSIIGTEASEASIITSQYTTLLRIQPHTIKNSPSQENWLLNFLLGVFSDSINRLRSNNNKILAEANLRARFGKFVVALMILMGVINFVAFFTSNLKEYVPLSWISMIGYFLCIGICLYGIKVVNKPLSFFGLRVKNWKKSITEGLVIGVVLLGSFNFLWEKDLLLEIQVLFRWGTARYFLGCIMQEFIARGVLQTSLQEFYQDKKGYLSIFIVSLLTAIHHMQFGFATTALSFLMAAFLGAIYIRHKNLCGIVIIHFCIGIIAYFLDLIPKA